MRIFILGFCCLFFPACKSVVHITGKPVVHINSPANTYNAENTYQKLVKDYPYIKIARAAVPSSVRAIKNITYVRDAKRTLQLDLYLPNNNQRTGSLGIIFIHGGGWSQGYRENFAPMAIAMAERGFVTATVSYRLSPEAKYPAAIQDVKAAVRWMRSHAKKYRLDPNYIAVAGGSAGGQIAALTGVTNGFKKFDPQKSIISSDVQAIINIDGLSDFTTPGALKYENDPAKQPSAAEAWFGGRYEEKPDVWREASPINYVRETTPPILFIGSAQSRFSEGRAEMIEKLRACGVHYQVRLIPDTPHSFWLFEPWVTPTLNAITDFLREEFSRRTSKK